MKLGTVAKVQGGYAFKSQEFQSEGVPIIRIGNLDGKNVEIDNDVCYPIAFWDKHPEFRVEKNNILIAMSGATVGKIGIYESDNRALLNQRVCILKPDENAVTNEYLYFFCMSPTFKNSIKENAFGCAQPNISATQICDFEINVPHIDEQRRWVNQLRKIKNIIDKREQELVELDNLIKSRFVEMFGKPVSNTKKWKTEPMSNVAPAVNYAGEFDEEVWLLNLDMVEAQTGRILDYLMISEEEVGNSTCTFDTSNVLYSKLRPYLNKVVIPNRCGYATSELVPLQPIQSKINREYLAFMLRNDEFVNMINEKVAGAKMPRVSMADFRKFDVPLPPIELQNEFTTFVTQVDKLKFEVQKALDETQILMDSLMQQYFG